MIDTTQFRKDFPAFADTTTYTEAAIRLWLSVAVNLVNADRWGALYDLGVELLTAHQLALGARDTATVTGGGIPGVVQGIQTSAAVDKVSYGSDAGSVTLEGGGWYNMTTYGIRFLQLARWMGSGGYQTPPGCSPGPAVVIP